MTRIALILLVAGLASGCGDHGGASRPTAAQLAGTYDVTTADVLSLAAIGDELLGVVTAGEDGTIRIDILRGTLAQTTLSGRLEDDGSVRLSGQDVDVGPASVVTGRAQVQIVEGTYRIGTTLEGDVFGPRPVNLTMERPVDASLASASGRYRFDFPSSPNGCNCPSSALLDLTFAPPGTGSGPPATDVAPSGLMVGTIEVGSAFLTPSGAFVLQARYHSASPVSDGGVIGFVGRFHPAGSDFVGAGTLEFAARFVPPFLPRGAWSAERVSP